MFRLLESRQFTTANLGIREMLPHALSHYSTRRVVALFLKKVTAYCLHRPQYS